MIPPPVYSLEANAKQILRASARQLGPSGRRQVVG